MARPSSQGPQAIAQDIQDLTRVLRRVESDTKRPAAEKEKLVASLKVVLNIFLVGERAGDKPARKTGS